VKPNREVGEIRPSDFSLLSELKAANRRDFDACYPRHPGEVLIWVNKTGSIADLILISLPAPALHLAAMRRASSRVSSFAAECRPGSSSK